MYRLRDQEYPKCTCGKRVSRQGRLCKACIFANINFKEKSCAECGIIFVPHSGIQKYCDKCKTNCSICGKKMLNRKNGVGPCLSCASKTKRNFKRVCIECGKEFNDKNNNSRYCKECAKIKTPKNCIDCGITITYGHLRCNSCNAKNRDLNVYKNGWAKYEYNGVRYRSKWEVEVARILTKCEVYFEYEVFHKETKTRPDFYFPKVDRYIEIHPDYHGKKTILPENCVLVKSLSHARAAAYAIALKLNRKKTQEVMNRLTKRQLIGIHKISFDAACYLRQLIYERDGK